MSKYYFTFMQSQTKLRNKYITFTGTYEEAREKMIRHFGETWAFQYNEDQWILEGKTQAQIFNLTEIK